MSASAPPPPRPPRLGTVYVLHFDETVEGKQRHYTGWTSDLRKRLYDHLHNGSAGARITRIARQRRITWTVAVTVRDVPMAAERQIKGLSAGSFCPLCGRDTRAVLGDAGFKDGVDVLPAVVPLSRSERFAKRPSP